MTKFIPLGSWNEDLISLSGKMGSSLSRVDAFSLNGERQQGYVVMISSFPKERDNPALILEETL